VADTPILFGPVLYFVGILIFVIESEKGVVRQEIPEVDKVDSKNNFCSHAHIQGVPK